MSESIFQQLSALLPAGCVRENVTLAPYTTMRTGGPAALFAEPRSAQQLAHVHQWAQEKGLPLLILGNGSNLLIADSGFDGLVIHLLEVLDHASHRVGIADRSSQSLEGAGHRRQRSNQSLKLHGKNFQVPSARAVSQRFKGGR